MAQKPKPERADVVIIGAGASGATAAKVLTERGMQVVALERGPWRKRESFGGDELANVNRYNLWPDPILNPRTLRTSADEEPKLDLFCPVPQMVGGGTVHWQGWLPRFTESDFRLRSIVGDIPGTTLVDWPISYADLEPYYTEVEWAFGVSGAGGVNKFEGFRSKDYPCPPLPSTRYGAKVSCRLSQARLQLLSDSDGGALAPLQRTPSYRPKRLCPAARRPNRHAIKRALGVRSRRAENRPLRSAAGLLRA